VSAPPWPTKKGHLRVKRSTGHTHTTAEHTTAEQTTHTNTERATAQGRLLVEVVVAALKIVVVEYAGGGAVYGHTGKTTVSAPPWPTKKGNLRAEYGIRGGGGNDC